MAKSKDCLLKKRTGASGDNLTLQVHHDEGWLDDGEELTYSSQDSDVPKSVDKEFYEEEEPKHLVRVKSNIRIEGKEGLRSLDLPTVISMTTEYPKNPEKLPKIAAEFGIENRTSGYYGFKILCNKSGLGVYEVSPSMGIIPPFEEARIRLEVKFEGLHKFLSQNDSLFIRGHPLEGPLDKAGFKKFMKAMESLWPKVGERFELKPLVLENELPQLMATLKMGEVRKTLEQKYVKDLESEYQRGKVVQYSQQMDAMALRIRKSVRNVSALHFSLNLSIFAALHVGSFWFILPFYYTDVEPVVWPEVSSQNPSWTSAVKGIYSYIFK